VVELERIHELRREIDRIDEEIMRLLDRRLELVSEIGRLKSIYDLDIRDLDREKYVLSRAGRYRDVFSEIIRLSLDIQEACLKSSVSGVKRRKIGIVGYGKMGSLFSRIFSRYHMVGVYDVRDVELGCDCLLYRDLGSLVRDMDVIMVATPLDNISSVLKMIRDIVVQEDIGGKLIFDIATIKRGVVNVLLSFPENIRVCSIHPLFGGNISTTFGRKIVLVPIRDDGGCRDLIDILSPYGFNFFISDYMTHDRMISCTIGLPYFIALVYGRLILDLGLGNVEPFGGTSYEIFRNYVESILLSDKPDFIASLLCDDEVRLALIRYLNYAVDILNDVSIESMSRLLDELRDRLTE
jgi:prephenate dehydrogenase/chorismate mutase